MAIWSEEIKELEGNILINCSGIPDSLPYVRK